MVTGLYLRVSTEEQVKEGYSIRAQEEKLRAYATLKDWKIYSVYADEGISGKDIEGRPQIKRLISDITSGKINNVLIYKIDRLTRSTKNLIELIDIFNQNNCAFNRLNESIDTTTATGRMFLKIVGIFAEFERENLAERLRMGFERKAREGYSICSHSFSYGYTKENGNKIQEVIEDEAEIVKRIFRMYLDDDYSLTQIAKLLNAENIPTKTGKRWTNVTIKKMLENCNYIGKVRYSTKDATRYFEVDGYHKPIIDESIFYQTQEKFSKMKKITRTKRPTHEAYFCGILYCPECGSKYASHWLYKKSKNEGEKATLKYPSYRCINAYKGFCTNKSHISHRKLEQSFETYIGQIPDLTIPADIQADNVPTDHTNEIATITAEIKQIEKKASEIMKLFATNDIDFNSYQNMLAFNNERLGELQLRLNLLQSMDETKTTHQNKSEMLASIKANWQALNNHQRLQFVQKFIKKLIAHGEVPSGGHWVTVIVDDLQFNDF